MSRQRQLNAGDWLTVLMVTLVLVAWDTVVSDGTLLARIALWGLMATCIVAIIGKHYPRD
jgi:hypothetical protein